tara:strand:+ start:319 stop:663 length:345 start_codon:yes stop_codon:yes gene_type:complete
MDNKRDDSEGTMTLSAVCALVGVSPRQVQYLREVGVVTPAVVSAGRGTSCMYSMADAVRIHIAAVELSGMEYEKRKEILDALASGVDPIYLSDYCSISVEENKIREELSGRKVD